MPCPPENSEFLVHFVGRGYCLILLGISQISETDWWNKIVSFWKQGDSSSATQTSQCVVCLVSFGLWDQCVTVNIVKILVVFGIDGFGWNGLKRSHKYACSSEWADLSPFFSCPEQLKGDLVPWSVCLTELTIRVFTRLQSDPRDLWPLRHLIRQICGKNSDFQKIFRFLENFMIFWRF